MIPKYRPYALQQEAPLNGANSKKQNKETIQFAYDGNPDQLAITITYGKTKALLFDINQNLMTKVKL